MSEVKIKELDKSLIHQANSNSMSGQRGDISAHEYEVYCQKVMSWNIPDSRKQTVEMELETLIRKEERRFPEMQDSGSAKIIPVKVKFRETRSRIWIFEYLKEAIKNGRSKID